MTYSNLFLHCKSLRSKRLSWINAELTSPYSTLSVHSLPGPLPMVALTRILYSSSRPMEWESELGPRSLPKSCIWRKRHWIFGPNHAKTKAHRHAFRMRNIGTYQMACITTASSWRIMDLSFSGQHSDPCLPPQTMALVLDFRYTRLKCGSSDRGRTNDGISVPDWFVGTSPMTWSKLRCLTVLRDFKRIFASC